MALKDKFSPLSNKIKSDNLNKLWVGISAVFLVLFIFAVFLIKHNEAKNEVLKVQQAEKAEKFASITSDFGDEDTRSAIHSEQTSMDSLQQEVNELKDTVKQQNGLIQDQQKQWQQQQDAQAKTISDLRSSMGGQIGSSKIHLTRQEAQSNLSALGNEQLSSDGSAIQPQLLGGLQRFDQTWSDDLSNNTEDNYIPSGTFAQAILLGGADASASVNGQSNTSPIIFRISDNGIEPNHKKAPLKDCVVVAETYGDISSERGEVRLNRLSCNKSDGTVLDIPIKGTVYDISGKEGIRGTPVMRNGKILFFSAASGFAAGIANAAQNAQGSQSTNPLGSVTTISPGKTAAYSAYGGLNGAANKLADYYIQRADQYHPIIELNAGAKVDVVFLEGFSLKSSISQTAADQTAQQSNGNSQAAIQQVLSNANQNTQIDQDSNGENAS